jgi:hypothetical protein
MRLKRVLGGAAAACALLVGSAATASANIMWCIGDPPEQVTSASGTQFVVNTQIYASGPKTHLNLSHSTTTTSWSQPDGHGGTLVTVEVQGPSSQQLTVVVTYNAVKNAVSNQATGIGTVIVQLDIPIS